MVAKGHGCSLLVFELCLVSVILFLSAKRVGQMLLCRRGKFRLENPYALLTLRAQVAIQLFSLVSKQIVVHQLCVRKAFSLDVILLINLYKNTVNCACDLVRMVAHASHDSHTKGHF